MGTRDWEIGALKKDAAVNAGVRTADLGPTAGSQLLTTSPQPPIDIPRWNRTQFWLGLAFGAGALWLAARGVDWGQVGHALGGVRLPFVALALLAYLVTTLVKAIRWRALFVPGRPAPRLGRAAGLLVIGQAANLLLPARVGDLARAYLCGEEAGISKAYALGTVAGEKLLDLVALAALILALLPFAALPAWLAERRQPVVLAALGLAAGVALLLAGRRAWLKAADRVLNPDGAWRARLAAGLDGLSGLANPAAVAAVWWWTVVAWLLAGVTNLLLFWAFSLPAGLLPAFFLLAVLQAGVALPSPPGRIGVFHALCVLALSVFGISGSAALSYGLVLHLVVVGSTAAWAAVALWQRSWSSRY